MGLDVFAKGLSWDESFHCGYLTYGNFLRNLAYAAYGEKMGRMFEEVVYLGLRVLTEEEEKYWDDHCDNDIDLFLFHTDCDGKFSPKECRRIYNAIKDIRMPYLHGCNYESIEPYNMLEHWKKMFKHCADRRVNMYFK